MLAVEPVFLQHSHVTLTTPQTLYHQLGYINYIISAMLH